MGEFFLEVRCEEIPARMLRPATRELSTRVFEELMSRQLPPRSVEAFFTPRRLALMLDGLAAREPDREEQVVGPPSSAALDADGRPTAAASGFARRCGVEVAQLETIRTEKGEYLAAIERTEGRPTIELLAELTPRILAGLNWPKVMRWGSGRGPWVRPVHGIVALFEGRVVEFELFGVASGDLTCGHPWLSPSPFQVAGSTDYRRKMAGRRIVVKPENREQRIRDEMNRLAGAAGGRVIDDPALLDKLAAICEVPGVVEGGFDPDYLSLPREVLITSLRDHQSAFGVESEGALLPRFLTVMDRADDPEGRVRAGNEWVVAARLEDARFFYQEDRKRPLSARRDDLEHLTFHARLGSYADKTARLIQLGAVICDSLGRDELKDDVVRAADLLKTDLTTEMVKEFTSLQGVMGGVYAREEGASDAVWQAIYDQYLPGTTDDPIPQGPVGQVVGLADRIDTLVGIFGLGLKPTSSKDPFGLRRAAQGVVRIALEGDLGIDLDLIAAKAFQLYGDRLELRGHAILEVWRPFLFDRVRYLLGLEGYAYDEIEAAVAVGGTNLPDVKARVDAIHRVRKHPGFLPIVLAAKRIANILKDGAEQSVREEALVESAERDLYEAFGALRRGTEEAESKGDFVSCLEQISGFAEVLDRFFVEVLVMDDDAELRNNRLALLRSIQGVLSRTAELTRLVVDKGEYRDG